MTTDVSRIPLFTLVLLVSLILDAAARNMTPPQAYSAVAIGTGGSVGGQINPI